LATREEEWNAQKFRGYPANGGLALTWVAPWEEGDQLTLDHLDLWFIEVCRRTRLRIHEGRLCGQSGNSTNMRIMAKDFHGDVGDPWAPIYVSEVKSFSLAERRFDYRVLADVLFSGDIKLPLLAKIAEIESHQVTMLLVAQAIASGQSTTSGFRSRILPIGGRISRALTLGPKRNELKELAKAQVEEIKKFDEALRDALALAGSGGQRDKIRKHYGETNTASTSFDRAADDVFFEHLWARFEAQDEGPVRVKFEAERFARVLYQRASIVFEDALPAIPCPSLFRPRAEARARGKFQSAVRFAFPELFPSPITQENNNAVAR
jgi:CRISPR system Cascade subunit CasA